MSRYSVILIASSLLAAACGGLIAYQRVYAPTKVITSPTTAATTTTATETVTATPSSVSLIIGTSTAGRTIERYLFGNGTTTLIFVGGIHGGYEWNSSALAYELIEALEQDSISLPTNVRIIIVPTLNPDGLYALTGLSGRFHVNDVPTNLTYDGTGRLTSTGVDLNRNFDCNWQPKGVWKNQMVSAGRAPFSEPESIALRDLVLAEKPVAVIFWHSQANAVYASECHNGILPNTRALMNIYAQAANYRAVESFDAYPVSGDAEGWLASLNIPAITVELASRTNTEWEQNLRAISATLDFHGKNF